MPSSHPRCGLGPRTHSGRTSLNASAASSTSFLFIPPTSGNEATDCRLRKECTRFDRTEAAYIDAIPLLPEDVSLWSGRTIRTANPYWAPPQLGIRTSSSQNAAIVSLAVVSIRDGAFAEEPCDTGTSPSNDSLAVLQLSSFFAYQLEPQQQMDFVHHLYEGTAAEDLDNMWKAFRPGRATWR